VGLVDLTNEISNSVVEEMRGMGVDGRKMERPKLLELSSI